MKVTGDIIITNLGCGGAIYLYPKIYTSYILLGIDSLTKTRTCLAITNNRLPYISTHSEGSIFDKLPNINT